MIYEDALNIYTDGSCLPHPRRGGIGIVVVYVDSSGNEIIEEFPQDGYRGSTINEMELLACIEALKISIGHKEYSRVNRIIINSDSTYVTDNFPKALLIWSKHKWYLSSDKPVSNAHLWKEFIRIRKKIRKYVEIKHVKGHSKDEHNKAADKLAKQSASIPINKPLAVTIVRRKKSQLQTQIGSVCLLGQRITIRIIECKYFDEQHISRYRYEVMSKKSPYFNKVDFLFSFDSLRVGHTYSVRLNNEQNNPRIIKVFHEIISKDKT